MSLNLIYLMILPKFPFPMLKCMLFLCFFLSAGCPNLWVLCRFTVNGSFAEFNGDDSVVSLFHVWKPFCFQTSSSSTTRLSSL